PGYPGAQNTRVAKAAVNKVAMALGYHSRALWAYLEASEGAFRRMSLPASPKMLRIFLRVLRLRRTIVVVFALLTAAGIYGALHIPNDPSIERLVVAGDPTAQATVDFEKIFPEGD